MHVRRIILLLMLQFLMAEAYAGEDVDFEVNLAEHLPSLAVVQEPNKLQLSLSSIEPPTAKHRYWVGYLAVDIGVWSFIVPQCLAQHIASRDPSHVKVSLYNSTDRQGKTEPQLDLEFSPPPNSRDKQAVSIRFRFGLDPLELRAVFQGLPGNGSAPLDVVSVSVYCHPTELLLLRPKQRKLM